MIKLLHETAAADALQLQPHTLRRWRFEGKGPAYCKIGGAIRYPVDGLEAFIVENRVAQND